MHQNYFAMITGVTYFFDEDLEPIDHIYLLHTKSTNGFGNKIG